MPAVLFAQNSLIWDQVAHLPPPRSSTLHSPGEVLLPTGKRTSSALCRLWGQKKYSFLLPQNPQKAKNGHFWRLLALADSAVPLGLKTHKNGAFWGLLFYEFNSKSFQKCLGNPPGGYPFGRNPRTVQSGNTPFKKPSNSNIALYANPPLHCWGDQG